MAGTYTFTYSDPFVYQTQNDLKSTDTTIIPNGTLVLSLDTQGGVYMYDSTSMAPLGAADVEPDNGIGIFFKRNFPVLYVNDLGQLTSFNGSGGSGAGITSISVGAGLSSTQNPITTNATIIVPENGITLNQIQKINPNILVGNPNSTENNVVGIPLGTNLSFGDEGELNAAGQIEKTTPVTTNTYNIVVTDNIILVDTVAIAAPCTLYLPNFVGTDSQTFTAVDDTGEALNYPITLDGNGWTINGETTFVLDKSRGAVSISWSTPKQAYTAVYNYEYSRTKKSILVTTTPYTVTNEYDIILVDTATIGGPSLISLLNFTAEDTRTFTVKDYGNAAATYPITVEGNGWNIDGSPTFVMDQNKQANSFSWDKSQTEYSVISEYGPTASSSPIQLNIIKFTESGFYTPSEGIKYCNIKAIGPGGGGGGAQECSTTTAASGSGGGGGGYAEVTLPASALGVLYVVTVGVGGDGGVYGVSNPGIGAPTSVGSLCRATGGAAGVNGDATPTVLPVAGGIGGIGTDGDIISVGGAGGYGQPQGALGVVFGGAGGSSTYGGSGVISAQNQAGADGGKYGCGGGGAAVVGVSPALNGGKGGDGFVIITEYL